MKMVRFELAIFESTDTSFSERHEGGGSPPQPPPPFPTPPLPTPHAQTKNTNNDKLGMILGMRIVILYFTLAIFEALTDSQ